MDFEISSIGLATAQGSAAEIVAGLPVTAPRDVPWAARLGSDCRLCHSARGLPDDLVGPERWRALALAALGECAPPVQPGAPIVVASCNGAADTLDASGWVAAFDSQQLLSGTPWAGDHVPVVSGSCASGLQALFLGAQLLAAGHDEVVVLAVDILSRASHENFAALRILASEPAAPWHPSSTGFIPGEAAVALRATRTGHSGRPLVIGEPVLGQDPGAGVGLRAVVHPFRSRVPSIVVGQGTGPVAVDEMELSVLDATIDRRIPVTTPQLHFGHTLGASGLLSVGLAGLAVGIGALPRALTMPTGVTSSDRPLADGDTRLDNALVVCRALSGACAATSVATTSQAAAREPTAPYRRSSAAEPTGHVVLRRINAEALRVRPAVPPATLFVRLEAPLVPAPAGSLGNRLLPHAVLEITPGSIPRAVARRWGYAGPALCLVGEGKHDAEEAGDALVRACQAAGRTVAQVRIRGTGYDREVEWDVQSG